MVRVFIVIGSNPDCPKVQFKLYKSPINSGFFLLKSLVTFLQNRYYYCNDRKNSQNGHKKRQGCRSNKCVEFAKQTPIFKNSKDAVFEYNFLCEFKFSLSLSLSFIEETLQIPLITLFQGRDLPTGQHSSLFIGKTPSK